MIRCHINDLEERCLQRGYKLAEVEACIVERAGDIITVDPDHAAYPRERPAGLGDMVAAGLDAIGITKSRVAAALGVKDCGCADRQAALNALGRRLGIGTTGPAAASEADRTASAPYP